jgi:hypothetical protein
MPPDPPVDVLEAHRDPPSGRLIVLDAHRGAGDDEEVHHLLSGEMVTHGQPTLDVGGPLDVHQLLQLTGVLFGDQVGCPAVEDPPGLTASLDKPAVLREAGAARGPGP